MTDDQFKKLLYRQMEEDKKNRGILTTQLYKPRHKKPDKYNYEKPKQKNSS